MTRFAIVLSLVLLLSSCGYYYSDLYVVNSGKVTLENVKIVRDHRGVLIGDIQPSRAAHISMHFPGEAGEARSHLVWSIGEQQFSTELCYYTSLTPPKGNIYISGGQVQFKCG